MKEGLRLESNIRGTKSHRGGSVYLEDGSKYARGFCIWEQVSSNDSEPNTAEIQSIGVAPEVQNMGIGSLLLKTATGEIKKLGFTNLILWVYRNNEDAMRFYERHGWNPDGGVDGEALRYSIKLR